MLKELKARYWDVQVVSENHPEFFFLGLREPKLRRVTRFVASEWKYFTGAALTIIGIIVTYIVG